MAAAMEDVVRTVVCFGDSNTWGYHGALSHQDRMLHADRWTTRLQGNLGSDVIVIPEGLNGRTTVCDDPHNWTCHGLADTGTGANGRRYLTPMLKSHNPIDVLVLALGCNDLKTRFNLSPEEVAKGCALLIEDIRRSNSGRSGSPPEIVLMSPPAVKLVKDVHDDFGPERAERSLKTINEYRKLAEKEGLAGFVSLEEVPVSEDGLHFDENGARVIADLAAEKVSTALGHRPAKKPRLEES